MDTSSDDDATTDVGSDSGSLDTVETQEQNERSPLRSNSEANSEALIMEETVLVEEAPDDDPDFPISEYTEADMQKDEEEKRKAEARRKAARERFRQRRGMSLKY
jgi:hypothetical protein